MKIQNMSNLVQQFSHEKIMKTIFVCANCYQNSCIAYPLLNCSFLQGDLLKNRQKPTATLIYTDNQIYNIYTSYIPPPAIINTFTDVKIH